MNSGDIFEIALAVIASLGGGALLVLAFSSWLGKLWAARILASDRASHERELEKLRSELALTNARNTEQLRRELDIAVATRLRETNEKVAIYRLTVDLIAEVLGDFDQAFLANRQQLISPERLDHFNRQRIKAYGYMAMLAPQPVMDACDALLDHLMLVIGAKRAYEWSEVRGLGIQLLNKIREDVGIDKSPIEYRGQL